MNLKYILTIFWLYFCSIYACKEDEVFNPMLIIHTEALPQLSSNNLIWNQGIDYYMKNEFNNAYNLWERLPLDNNKNDTLIFYKAIASMPTKKWDDAIQHFNRINAESVFYQRALLYKSLAYYQKGESEQFHRLFQQVSDNNLSLYQHAQDLSDKNN